eukprot:NODE_5485_length_672_cov_23.712681_g5110_i0.p1 GENE.NODE_5485_length_672_cov_23.712681_g5110_i0~~NODE_5485_length_672_cov_23.712681_g5110_i0.p1  ORF type:complete len:152 (+),score=39.34 NODE_5485_length_672_cov_23.712681_g5110_i0:57-512(+)
MATDTFNWGDDADDTFLDLDTGRKETTADDGVKTITEVIMRDGKKFKVTKKVKTITKTVRVNRRAEDRLRKWKPFGMALENDASITVPDRDHIAFDVSGQTKKQSAVERKIQQDIERLLQKAAQKEVIAEGAKFQAKSLRAGGKPAPNAGA